MGCTLSLFKTKYNDFLISTCTWTVVFKTYLEHFKYSLRLSKYAVHNESSWLSRN